jgi:nicotinate-nucleotide adenylyltransferase
VFIGVLGGSFDPVHVGHLVVAEAAADRLGLDQVRLVPACVQPFKRDAVMADAAHRVAMLETALSGNPRILVDGREIARGGLSYTLDTLESLHAEFPGDRLFLMVGADAARDVPEWRGAARFPELCTVVVLTRPGATPANLPGAMAVEVPSVEVSSTEIRDRVRDGRSIRDLVPPGVGEYIDARRLYR